MVIRESSIGCASRDILTHVFHFSPQTLKIEGPRGGTLCNLGSFANLLSLLLSSAPGEDPEEEKIRSAILKLALACQLEVNQEKVAERKLEAFASKKRLHDPLSVNDVMESWKLSKDFEKFFADDTMGEIIRTTISENPSQDQMENNEGEKRRGKRTKRSS